MPGRDEYSNKEPQQARYCGSSLPSGGDQGDKPDCHYLPKQFYKTRPRGAVSKEISTGDQYALGQLWLLGQNQQ